MIYDPKRQTCTFDFYPDWYTEPAKCVFVSGAVFFCCVAPLAAITALSVAIIVKVKERTKKMALQQNGKDGTGTSPNKVPNFVTMVTSYHSYMIVSLPATV